MSEELKDLLRDVGLLVLRVGVGVMMIVGHGYPKWLHYAEKAGSFPDPLGVGAGTSLSLAIFAELVCSALVVVGLATRFAAIPLLFTMGMAAFVIHADDPWSKQEFALLYGVPFLTILLTGPGRISVDAVIGFWRGD